VHAFETTQLNIVRLDDIENLFLWRYFEPGKAEMYIRRSLRLL